MNDDLINAYFGEKGDLLKSQIIEGIQAQYRNTNLEKLIYGIIELRTKNIIRAYESLIRDNISLSTAKGDGLDLWGVILGLSRHILLEDNSIYELTDDEMRTLLITLYQKQYINLNINSVNSFAKEVFANYGNVKIGDTNDMSYIIYEFTETLPDWLRFLLLNKDILPRPAGVGIKIQDSKTAYRVFGFQASAHDKTSNPARYEARVAWFNENIGGFGNVFAN